MRKATVRATTSRQAIGRSLLLANSVSGAATEALRVRRDPAVVALRRRRAAVRRTRIWGAGTVASGAVGTAWAINLASGGVTATGIGFLILAVAVLIWCAAGLARAVGDLRARTRDVRALPPPQPARQTVAPVLAPQMAQLDGYSDGLRSLLGMIGVEGETSTRTLRADILSSADAVEVRLRRRAAELTRVLHAREIAPADARTGLEDTARLLAEEIRDGVAEYGRLVGAAGETVAASRSLAPQSPDLGESTEQLRALAIGMRELTSG